MCQEHTSEKKNKSKGEEEKEEQKHSCFVHTAFTQIPNLSRKLWGAC